MKLLNYKIFALQFLLLNQLFLGDIAKPKQNLVTENINKPSRDYIRNIPDNNFYILGPGDVLSLKVSDDTPELNKIFTIDGEGVTYLERLNRVYSSGLTIEELTEILNNEYSEFVKEPDVELLIVNYRPIKVYLDGEVEEPGLHVLPGSSSPSESVENFNSSNNLESKLNINKDANNLNNIFFPSVIDAMRKSGGVTMFADLTNIKVTRVNSISKGKGRIGTTINLLDTLDLKDNSQNIRIFDGDTIFIPKNEEPILSQISKAIKSNINPKYIDVYLGGRVNQPGPISVSKSAVLTEALEIGGGAKTLKGKVVFLRYNYDGTIDRRKFNLSHKASRGTYKNPFLKNGDVIYISKSAFNTTSEIMSEITSPLQSFFTSYGLYQLLVD